MKQFIKIFIFSFVIFSLVASAGIFTYVKYLSPEELAEADPNKDGDGTDEDTTDKEFKTPLEKAIHESNRTNVLLVGLEGTRSDTIMLVSFDRKTKKANLISIPRDTYYYREGYGKYTEFQKINAVYGMEEDGIKALIRAVEELTGIPIDNYATIEYDGLRAAVDAIGGVEFDVPFHMRYTDIYDKPPLDINIPAGKQLIKGNKAMELLRFRKTNYPGYSGYANGDLGRVETQQKFIKAAVKKAMSLKLPSVISAVYPHVKTDFTLTDLLGLGKDVIGFSAENLETSVLPGTDKWLGGLSFYQANGEEITKFVYDLYDLNLSANANEDKTAELN
jgi:LCP family protein required for cell wall assembly